MKKEKILILSGSYGDGHQQAANAIREAARLRYPDMEVVVLDFMEFVHPYINPISRYVFAQGIKKFPSLHGYLYQKTRDTSSPLMLKTLNLLSARRMLNLLEEIQPSVVISTFPFAAAAISILKSHGLTSVPSVTIITDHTDHSYWIHPYTDQYIVGSELVREALHQSGIPDSQISITGIPIGPEFSMHYPARYLQIKHGLDPELRTVLVMGGGWGIIGNGVSSMLALEDLLQPIQLIIICGRNEKLRKQLTERLKYSKHRIRLTGYIDYVHELMAVSDIMITKPGGLTTSEAIAMQLPMLLYKPLPGQEQDNAKFLLQAGVAMQAEDTSDLTGKLASALENPQCLLAMKEKTRQFHTKSAAFEALEIALQTMRTENLVLEKAYV